MKIFPSFLDSLQLSPENEDNFTLLLTILKPFFFCLVHWLLVVVSLVEFSESISYKDFIIKCDA